MSKHRNCAFFQETRKSDNGGQNSLGHLSMIVVLQTLGKLAICLQVLHRKLNVPRTFAHFRSEAVHAQAEAHSGKSYLALWIRPKRFLQTLRKPESAKSFLALWNRSKLVLQTLDKLAIRLQALDRKLNVPGTFAHFRSGVAHAQGDAESAKSFLAV